MMRMKALIIYGTRSGSTKQIADEIGKVFGGAGFVVTVLDAKKSRGVDVNAFDLVVVGSSVWATLWKWQATRFLKRNVKNWQARRSRCFRPACSAATLPERTKPKPYREASRKVPVDQAAGAGILRWPGRL